IQHFKARHEKHLATSRASNLDSQQASVLNPHAVNHFFDWTEAEYQDHQIQQMDIWAADEFGITKLVEATEQVVYCRGKKHPPVQQSGEENIPVMATVCADGECLPSWTIYKGEQ
ncbi:uncharacterized protein C8Q71DRAFT_676761, partial [Rhodofomes roseus]